MRCSYRYSAFCCTAANEQYWNFCVILMTNIRDLGIGGASHQQSTGICSRQHDINQNILNQTQREIVQTRMESLQTILPTQENKTTWQCIPQAAALIFSLVSFNEYSWSSLTFCNPRFMKLMGNIKKSCYFIRKPWWNTRQTGKCLIRTCSQKEGSNPSFFVRI